MKGDRSQGSRPDCEGPPPRPPAVTARRARGTIVETKERAMETTMSPEQFWEMVDKSSGPDACWPWMGRKRRKYRKCGAEVDTYGVLRLGGHETAAHRIAYQMAYGDYPDTMLVLHSCDNPPCCNPAHLSLGTQSRNMWERNTKGRTAKGEQLPQTKLTEKAVQDIRRQYKNGASMHALAREYSVDRITIRLIVRRLTWKHVK
jgi:hypothetical protein